MRIFVLDDSTIVMDEHCGRIIYLSIVLNTEIVADIRTYELSTSSTVEYLPRIILLRILELPQSITVHSVSRRTRIIKCLDDVVALGNPPPEMVVCFCSPVISACFILIFYSFEETAWIFMSLRNRHRTLLQIFIRMFHYFVDEERVLTSPLICTSGKNRYFVAEITRIGGNSTKISVHRHITVTIIVISWAVSHPDMPRPYKISSRITSSDADITPTQQSVLTFNRKAICIHHTRNIKQNLSFNDLIGKKSDKNSVSFIIILRMSIILLLLIPYQFGVA